ncbi:MAG: cation:proton antiporter [Proteobacteria bacterium]|nr:cation:proton antiporter [Pseudomonadota bacterium]
MEYILERAEYLLSLPLANSIALFTFVLAIILVVPILTNKIRVPQVIGLILCGVLVGPHAADLIHNDDAIRLLSTTGLLYVMFMAGLELDINQFKVNRNRSLAFGVLTYLGPLVIVFPICYWGYHLTFLESFLIGSMLGAHTLIAYPAASRFGIVRDPAVSVTVGGTILVDAGVLVLLAIILGIASGNVAIDFWVQLILSLVVFSAIMFFVIPKIGEIFFSNLNHERYLRYVFVLFILFASALLAELAGLEAIVGAFIAGLVLNRLIPASSGLMRNIEFVGNALFIPIFLVSVGMLVDLGVLFSGPAIIILTIILSVAALLGKWAAAFSTQKLFGYSKHQRGVIFGLSASHVATTLAVILVGYRVGLINDTFFNATIILILITCIVASIVTEKAAKTLAQASFVPSKIRDDASLEHILLLLDNIKNGTNLIAFALLFKSPQSHASVSVVSILKNTTQAEEKARALRQGLALMVQVAQEAHVRVGFRTIVDSSIVYGVARAAREQHANVTIMGWPRVGFTERILGEKWKAVVSNLHQLVVFADVQKSFATIKRINLFTLPYAEREAGFDTWFDKLTKIASEGSLTIQHYGDESTHQAMIARSREMQVEVVLAHRGPSATDADGFKKIEITPDAVVVAVAARTNTLSYAPVCRHAPEQLQKYYPDNNKLLILPPQPSASAGEYDD